MKLYNTLSRQKEIFIPIDPQHIRVYACGPTVYDRAHVGNARPAVVFDVLVRLLRRDYPKVTYVRNITDVDDKINARAQEAGRSIYEITRETIDWYHTDMQALGVLPPDHEPHATEYIAEMQKMITVLIDKGYAYVVAGHVYFSVRKDPSYGGLSGRTLDEMRAGARVEIASEKQDPLDFVLWKPETDDGPSWPSPWGQGRPGWHIECSAMSEKLLGDVFDIHAGGIDLAFPHHENEIAQSCAAHGTTKMANYWLHNEMLQVEGKKMSKSLGNFFTVRDLLDQGIPGEVIRFVLLSTHYARPMDFSRKKTQEAEKTLRKWYDMTKDAKNLDQGFDQVLDALRDDLNTPAAITHLHELAHKGEAGALLSGARALGLLEMSLADWLLAPVIDPTSQGRIKNLITQRLAAKKDGDFIRADFLRDRLQAAGIILQDGKDGTDYVLGPNFHIDKLGDLPDAE